MQIFIKTLTGDILEHIKEKIREKESTIYLF